LFLDEFAGDLDGGVANTFDGAEGERARRLYENVFLGYGDDSVAQLGGAHVAVEWVSNILTKVLQRGRLAAYLEQSTRYIAYDGPGVRAAAPAPEGIAAARGARGRRDDPAGASAGHAELRRACRPPRPRRRVDRLSARARGGRRALGNAARAAATRRRAGPVG